MIVVVITMVAFTSAMVVMITMFSITSAIAASPATPKKTTRGSNQDDDAHQKKNQSHTLKSSSL